MKKLLTALLFGIMAILLAACSTNKPVRKVRVVYSPALCESFLHVAMDKGFFEAEGLQVEKVPVDAAKRIEVMGAGQGDISGGLIAFSCSRLKTDCRSSL